MRMLMTDKKKSLDSQLNDLLSGINLPSDDEVRVETKNAKISLANTGRKHGEEHRRKSARPGKLNGFYGRGNERKGKKNSFYGKTHDEETRVRLAEKAASRGKTHFCKFCKDHFTAQAYDQYHGKYCSKNPKRIIKSRKKKDLSGPQDLLTCPYCGYEGGEGNMKRYHMDACEFNGHYIVSYQDGKKVKVYKSLAEIENDGINWHKVRNCILGKSARAYKVEWKKIKR